MTKEKLLNILSEVNDPISGNSLSKSRRIQQFILEREDLHLSLAFRENLEASQKSNLILEITQRINSQFPRLSVHVHLEKISGGIGSNSLSHIQNSLAVASGKGGVGKSTVSTNLAVGLSQRGYKVGLMDADLYGPSIPKMFGLEKAKPKVVDVDGKPMLIPIEKDGIFIMSIGFIVEPEQAVVLRGPRLAGIIKQFLQDCQWPGLDYLIIDLPPGTGDIQLTLVQSIPLTGSIIVTTPQEVAVVDALKAANMFLLPSINVPLLGIVENMSWFSPPDLPQKKYHLFGKGGGEKLSKKLSTPLLGQLPQVEQIMLAGEHGVPILKSKALDSNLKNAWNSLHTNLLQQMEIRNSFFTPTAQVMVK